MKSPAAVRTRSTFSRSASLDASGWSGSKRPKNVHVACRPGSSSEVGDWIIGQATSCCRRSPGRPSSGSIRPASRYDGPSSCIASVAKTTAPSRQPCATHGCAVALGKVLAARHHRAAPAMPGDAVVDVLRDIGLVAHDEAAVAETDVLHERRIAGHRPGAGVLHLHPPEPEVVARMQPERDTVPQACSLALPCEAIIRGAEAALGAGPDSFHDRRLRRAHPQVEAGDPTVDRRAMDLIDQRPPVLVLVLDRKHTTVGKDADRKAGGEGRRHRFTPQSSSSSDRRASGEGFEGGGELEGELGGSHRQGPAAHLAEQEQAAADVTLGERADDEAGGRRGGRSGSGS